MVRVGLSFQSYLADGTSYEGCHFPLVTTEIKPREKASLMCNKAIVPLTLKDLQITARIRETGVVALKGPKAALVDSGLVNASTALDKEMKAYGAFARVKTLTGRDIRALVLFRFYDAEGTQVATCKSGDVLIEPEVVLKTTCLSPVLLDAISPQPKTVRVEIRDAEW
jgi:hypothetical protein